MKKLLLIATLLIISILPSCEEDEKIGFCYACCDANNMNICYADFSESKCKDYNNGKVDGFSWSFFVGPACPPSLPTGN